MRRPVSFVSVLLLGLLHTRLAAAHIEITSHETRYGPTMQKQPPCGVAGGSGPGANVYVFEPGAMITIAWHEFVDHPGHYRVAFDAMGDDDFVDPASADDLYSNAAVLLDGIPDEPDVHDYEVQVQLPSVECEQCTIQVLQIMTDKPPFADGNDMYYHCIDVQLIAGGGTSESGDSTESGDSSSGESGESGSGDSSDSGESGPTTLGETETDADAGAGADEAGCACTSGDMPPAGISTGLALLGLLGLRSRRR